MNTKINHLAVWILVVVHQLVGWGWYTIFGDIWLNYHAKTMTDIERTHSFVPYETNPWPLVFIDMGRPFVAFALSGLVLGAWRKSR